MKLTSFFTLFVCLVALSNAAPIPGHGGNNNASGSGSNDKGKGRETTPSPPPSESSWSSSRAHTPTPAEDPNVPLPGRSGTHHDTHTGVTTAYYGDDHLPEHMGHVQRNQALHRGNRRPMPLASDRQHDQNRADALRGIPSGGNYRNTDEGAVRDEKHLAMLHNKHHATTTTVERLPAGESSKEGGLTSTLKKDMETHKSKGQIRANPGWLPLHPDQRIAHEAPARLNSQTHRPVDPNAAAKKTTKPKPDPEHLKAEAEKKAKGYTPTVGPSGMSLRHRLGVAPPPPPVHKDPKPPTGHTNLVPGRVGPPGHLWHPNAHGATHAGAPAPVSDAHTNSRHPPRPQDHDHYMRQQHEAHAAAQAALQRPHTPPPPHHEVPTRHQNNPNFAHNLANFNAAHPAHAPVHGGHHAEAPARLQHTPEHHDAHTTHTTAQPHHNAPSASTPHHGALPHHPAPASGSQKKSGKK